MIYLDVYIIVLTMNKKKKVYSVYVMKTRISLWLLCLIKPFIRCVQKVHFFIIYQEKIKLPT